MNKTQIINNLLDLIDTELEKNQDEICVLREEYYGYVDKIEEFLT